MLNQEEPKKDCIYYCNKYVDKKATELEGCSTKFQMSDTVFSAFNHLSIYFPEAYKHMLKVWEVENA